MTVVSDIVADADKLLAELLDLQVVARIFAENTEPYEVAGNGRTLTRFNLETSQALYANAVEDMCIRYPQINKVVSNCFATKDGQMLQPGGMWRINDAVFKFGEAQKEVWKAECIIKDQDQREMLSKIFKRVVADLAIFIMTNFRLYAGMESVTMSIHKHCEREGITPDVMYGIQLSLLRDFSKMSWYSWEPISPMYDNLNAFDQNLSGECEELCFPLTDDITDMLCQGTISVDVVKKKMQEYENKRRKQNKSKDGDDSTDDDSGDQIEDAQSLKPSNLVSRMRL